jgi:hypothetical protein
MMKRISLLRCRLLTGFFAFCAVVEPLHRSCLCGRCTSTSCTALSACKLALYSMLTVNYC